MQPANQLAIRSAAEKPKNHDCVDRDRMCAKDDELAFRMGGT
jgi:hypothetical protein